LGYVASGSDNTSATHDDETVMNGAPRFVVGHPPFVGGWVGGVVGGSSSVLRKTGREWASAG
jgi:hypothetical protein